MRGGILPMDGAWGCCAGRRSHALRRLCAVVVPLLALGLSAPSASHADVVASLSQGQIAYWPGAFVASGRVDNPSLCGIQGPCFDYGIRVVSPHAKALRVAIDSADESNGWEMQLIDPSGQVVADDTTYQEFGLGERLDLELFAHNPVPGVWTARVIAQQVQTGDFRARAALDPATPGGVGPAAAPVPTPALRSQAACRSAGSFFIGLSGLMRRVGVRGVRVYVNGKLQSAVHGARKRARVKLSGRPGASRRVVVIVSTRQGPMTIVRTFRLCSTSRSVHARTAGAQPRAVADVPPDIVPDPPWHVTFNQPPPQVLTESGNLAALAGVHNPVAQVGGAPVYTCLPEETVEQAGKRCLRFSSGVASTGPGRLEVYGSANVPVAVNGGPLFQVVDRSDGSTYSRPAGTFVFHQIHLHYHVLDLAQFPLYRVQPDHNLVPAGNGLKEGFCLGNLKLFDWSTFAASEIDPNSIDNCEPQAHMDGTTQLPDGTFRFYEGVANGWEDVYTWATSGQYVDFGNNPDGFYLLRMIVNPARHFLESSYGDNTAYTYFQVIGTDVRVIERGRGSSPWDTNKQVLDPVITR
jgi:Lysyl oxidase